jgi:hypothetical protein
MWAVYFCGATDCFFHACFSQYGEAEEHGLSISKNPEGFIIKEWPTVNDIDTSDTGWHHITQKDGD